MLEVRDILEDYGLDEPLTFSEGRALTPADLAMPRVGVSSPSTLQRLRSRHHALAKALAQGMRPGIAAATYGYSASRVSILAGDPAFRELVEHYRKEADFDYARMQERLTGIAVEAMDEIERRLEEAPEKIKTKELKELVELGTDRTGHGPRSQQDVNVNVGFADRLREARKRIEAKAIEGPILDAEILPREAAE